MPPGVGRFAHQNLSNPFPHLNQHAMHQPSHLPQPGQNVQAQNLVGHPGFGASNQNNNLHVFGPTTGNTALQQAFGGGSGIGGPGGGGGTGLASHAAQMGFHGAGLQQQAHDGIGANTTGSKGQTGRIREVWKSNLAQEMDVLRRLIDRYPYVSMDTEFPGVVARPMGEFNTKASYHYQTLRCNVDLLKIIQLGITLFTTEGEITPAQIEPGSMTIPAYPQNIVVFPCTWSFNFQFNLDEDMYNEDSIAILKKAGADFDKHITQGIDPQEFGSLLITSGLALSDDVNWISFHSGYDFAYLVKLMWCQPLPNDEEEYRKLVSIFFPRLLDVKFLWRHAINLQRRGTISSAAAAHLNNLGGKSGLQDLADELRCSRIGSQHSAGSDAWLTGAVFWQLRAKIFDGHIPEDMNGQMWGLTGVGAPASAATQAAVLAAQGHTAGGVNGGSMANALNGGLAFHTAGTPSTHRDGPSTPTTTNVGLASTGQVHHGGMMTPGGAFGNFQYGK